MLTISKISEAVQAVAPVYGIDSVYLFGSYARGDATEDSDCDLRVVGGDIPTLFALGGLYEDLITSLGCKVDIVMTDSMSESFYRLIKNEERLVYAKI
ncbi:nucleotidyltransferase [Fibrobacteres bacterium R8-0-B4]